MPPTLLTLPLEILITILTNLPASSLSSCLQTSSSLHSIITTSTPLLLILEKCLAGVEDNFNCTTLLPSERLKYLRERERAWNEFTPRWKRKVVVEHKASGIYDLTPNVYFLGRQAADFGAFGGGGSESDAVMCLKLPERKEEEEEEEEHEGGEEEQIASGDEAAGTTKTKWREIGLEGKRIKDFGTALEEHNLIALVVSEPIEGQQDSFMLGIALLRYSTGRYHESAKLPIIPIHEYSSSQGPPSVSIEIVGENLALIVMYPHIWEDDDDILVIYDWKLGTTKTETPFDIANIGLCFLTETLLVHPNRRDESLDVYRIPYSREGGKVVLVLQLCLPIISRDYLISTLSCRGEPNPIGQSSFCDPNTLSSAIPPLPPTNTNTNPYPHSGPSTPYSPSPSHPYPHPQSGSGKYAYPTRPFTSLPSEALIIFQMDLIPQTDGILSQSFEFVIHRSSLLAQTEKWVRMREEEDERRRERRRQRREERRERREERRAMREEMQMQGEGEGDEEEEKRSIRERLKDAAEREYVPGSFVVVGPPGTHSRQPTPSSPLVNALQLEDLVDEDEDNVIMGGEPLASSSSRRGGGDEQEAPLITVVSASREHVEDMEDVDQDMFEVQEDDNDPDWITSSSHSRSRSSSSSTSASSSSREEDTDAEGDSNHSDHSSEESDDDTDNSGEDGEDDDEENQSFHSAHSGSLSSIQSYFTHPNLDSPVYSPASPTFFPHSPHSHSSSSSSTSSSSSSLPIPTSPIPVFTLPTALPTALPTVLPTTTFLPSLPTTALPPMAPPAPPIAPPMAPGLHRQPHTHRRRRRHKRPLTPPRIRWIDWGTKITRWFNTTKLSHDYITMTSGQRVVHILAGARDADVGLDGGVAVGDGDGGVGQGQGAGGAGGIGGQGLGQDGDGVGQRRGKGSPIWCLDFSPRRVRKMEREVLERVLEARKREERESQDLAMEDQDHNLASPILTGTLPSHQHQHQDPTDIDPSTTTTSLDPLDLIDPTHLEHFKTQNTHSFTHLITSTNTNSFNPTSVFSPSDFTEALPFIHHVSNRRYAFDAVVLDEQRVVGFKANKESYEMEELYVMFFG